MRYWIRNEDEDYERELEHVRRSGGALPAPVSLWTAAGIAFLVVGEAVLFASLAFDFLRH